MDAIYPVDPSGFNPLPITQKKLLEKKDQEVEK